MRLPAQSSIKKRGVTIAEILLALAILLFVAAVTIPLYGNFNNATSEQETLNRVVEVLRKARANAFASLGDAASGVYFSKDSGGNSTYTIYRGSSYATRDSSYDLTAALDSSFDLSTDAPLGDINFSKGFGRTNPATIKLSHASYGSSTITLNALGVFIIHQ